MTDSKKDAAPAPAKTKWTDFTPAEAVHMDLSKMPEIEAPLNEVGERCSWPWDPEQLVGAPIGQYHCPYCGARVVAGMQHVDYRLQEGPSS